MMIQTLIAPMFKAEDIASTELDQIVGNLEELKKCHEAILPQLDSCPTAGQMLIRISSTIDPYIPYVANRARSAPVLLSVRDRHGFTQVMRVCVGKIQLDHAELLVMIDAHDAPIHSRCVFVVCRYVMAELDAELWLG